MVLYEIYDGTVDRKMVVGGSVSPAKFHQQAEKAGHPAEHLEKLDPELILPEEVLALHGISNAELLRGKD